MIADWVFGSCQRQACRTTGDQGNLLRRGPIAQLLSGGIYDLRESHSWKLRSLDRGKYIKLRGVPDDNWVWSPQGVVDMHTPQHGGASSNLRRGIRWMSAPLRETKAIAVRPN